MTELTLKITAQIHCPVHTYPSRKEKERRMKKTEWKYSMNVVKSGIPHNPGFFPKWTQNKAELTMETDG